MRSHRCGLITTITALLVLAGLPAAASAAPRGLPGTVACERASGDRQTVLLVHGTLHAQGWDHETSEADAQEMEAYETAILQELGYADPYAP